MLNADLCLSIHLEGAGFTVVNRVRTAGPHVVDPAGNVRLAEQRIELHVVVEVASTRALPSTRLTQVIAPTIALAGVAPCDRPAL